MAAARSAPVPENGMSAPKTGDTVASSTDQLSPETKTEFRDAGEILAEFNSLRNNLETEALPIKESVDKLLPALEKVFPLLVRMQALLSQRGAEHLHEAGLPTWGEYYDSFRKKHGLPSIKTFQRKLAALHGDSSKDRPARKK